MNRLPLLLALLAGACAVDANPGALAIPDPLPSDGRTLVIDSIDVPSSAREANAFALDLDGDDIGDNLFGQSLAVAETSLGVDLDAEVAEALERGELLHLLMFASDDTGEALDTGRLFLGADTDGDPSNNFSGAAELAIREGASLDDAAFGEVDLDAVDLASGTLEVENVLFAPVRLSLHGARIVGRFDALGRFEGRLGGGVVEPDLTDLRASVSASIAGEGNHMCDPSQIPCCPAGSRGALYMEVFDRDNNCRLESAEVADSELFDWLIAADIDLDGDGSDDAMSVGFRITAVPARFEIP